MKRKKITVLQECHGRAAGKRCSFSSCYRNCRGNRTDECDVLTKDINKQVHEREKEKKEKKQNTEICFVFIHGGEKFTVELKSIVVFGHLFPFFFSYACRNASKDLK